MCCCILSSTENHIVQENTTELACVFFLILFFFSNRLTFLQRANDFERSVYGVASYIRPTPQSACQRSFCVYIYRHVDRTTVFYAFIPLFLLLADPLLVFIAFIAVFRCKRRSCTVARTRCRGFVTYSKI